ncbi:MAG: galactose mutarotase [Rubellimicrobium sp.]|nr:galactose mutarotase [Rubellimicrobium sp.]
MTPFGTLPDGRTVDALTIAAGDLTVRLLTLGATLQDVRLKGTDRNLTLASDNPADYLGALLYFGALVGPVANRLTGASAVIDGKRHHFEANQDGKITLHSASTGTHAKLWDVADHGPDHATLTLTLPDGEGGFPGNRRITTRFTVTAPATLRMEVTGETDAPSLMNFANHAYWNLNGSPTWAGHSLRIAADRYTPVDDNLLPLGEARDVTGTPFDLRQGRVMIPGTGPDIAHNFCLSNTRQPLRDVLWLTGTSGVTMTLATTEPGVQVYDAARTARPGQATREGFAIEAQGWPDAPNQPGFPSIDLLPGQPVTQVTEWRFASR